MERKKLDVTILYPPIYPLCKVSLPDSCQLFEIYCWELPTNRTMNSRLLVAQRLCFSTGREVCILRLWGSE